MEQYDYFGTTAWHKEEDAVVWCPVPGSSESTAFDDMISRMALPADNEWSWCSGTTPAQYQYTHVAQSTSSTSPEHSHVGFASTQEEQCASSSLDLGIPTALQWPVAQQHHYPNALVCNDYSQMKLFPRPPQETDCQPGAATEATELKTDNPSQSLPLHPPLQIPWPDVFASTKAAYKDPPLDPADGQQPQRKAKRSAEDLYTPHWVRNHGTQREGWCGWCHTWLTLRDSTYWYHMHYSHGISQANGKRLPAPAGFKCESAEWEVKCGMCNKWMPLPPGDRWNTQYFRHTYKCYYFKAGARMDSSGPSSPVGASARPRRTISNVL